jgi:hypothetical protein
VPVPCFLLFLCFRKATHEIFSELDKTSSETPILPGRMTRTKREPERGQWLATQQGAWLSPWLRPPIVRPPWSTSDDAPSPIRTLPTEKPKTIGEISRRFPQLRRYRRQISGDRSLCSGTLPGQGSAPEPSPSVSIAVSAVSIDLTTISIAVAASDDEEGVVLPRGRGLYW